MSKHESAVSLTDEWLTPPEIVKSLGEFDLDPCSPVNRPWPTAKKHYTIDDNGLLQEWDGRVWMNPPYGKALGTWLNRLALHNDGIAMVFARTDTAAFHDHVFPYASSMLFIRNRVTFYNVLGQPGKYNGGAPSVLISYGERNMEAISESRIPGKHVLINHVPVIVIGMSPTWKHVVSITLVRLGRTANLQQVYDAVEVVAPDKVEKNQHFKEKVRQTLQTYFERVGKGVYTMKNAS